MGWEKRAAWSEIRQLADALDWYVERWNELGADGGSTNDGGLPGPWVQEIASEVEALLTVKAINVERIAAHLRRAADDWETTEDTSTTSLRVIEDDLALRDG